MKPSNHSLIIEMLLVLLCLFLIGGQTANGQVVTPEGVRILQNKSFDDSPQARQEILELYEGLRLTDVLDGMDLIGLQDIGLMDNRIRPLWRDADSFSHRAVGFALTVRYVPTDVRVGVGSHASIDAAQEWKGDQYGRAPDPWARRALKPGDFIVMDVHGVHETGNIGSNNAMGWAVNGAVGVVTNGGARDTDELVKTRAIPVYTMHGYSTRGVRPGRLITESYNFPVSVGGVTVFPGDVIVADGDGVVVVPREHALEVGRLAREIEAGDQASRARKYEALGIPLDETVRDHVGSN